MFYTVYQGKIIAVKGFCAIEDRKYKPRSIKPLFSPVNPYAFNSIVGIVYTCGIRKAQYYITDRYGLLNNISGSACNLGHY